MLTLKVNLPFWYDVPSSSADIYCQKSLNCCFVHDIVLFFSIARRSLHFMAQNSDSIPYLASNKLSCHWLYCFPALDWYDLHGWRLKHSHPCTYILALLRPYFVVRLKTFLFSKSFYPLFFFSSWWFSGMNPFYQILCLLFGIVLSCSVNSSVSNSISTLIAWFLCLVTYIKY